MIPAIPSTSTSATNEYKLLNHRSISSSFQHQCNTIKEYGENNSQSSCSSHPNFFCSIPIQYRRCHSKTASTDSTIYLNYKRFDSLKQQSCRHPSFTKMIYKQCICRQHNYFGTSNIENQNSNIDPFYSARPKVPKFGSFNYCEHLNTLSMKVTLSACTLVLFTKQFLYLLLCLLMPLMSTVVIPKAKMKNWFYCIFYYGLFLVVLVDGNGIFSTNSDSGNHWKTVSSVYPNRYLKGYQQEQQQQQQNTHYRHHNPLRQQQQQQHQQQQEAMLRQQHLSDFFTTQSFFDHTAKCFSCMSKLYEAVWPALAHIYKKPLNFTDACNGDGLLSGGKQRYGNGRYNDQVERVPVQHCSTICVGMWEETTVAGVKIRAHIRGCMDDVLHNGFNETIVALYRWMHRDSCRDYRKRELFKLAHDQSDDSSVHVCTCYADHCNAAPSSALTISISRAVIVLSLIAMLYLIV